MTEVFDLQRSDGPLLVSMPHDGSAIPDELSGRMTVVGRQSVDTDWHVGRLYGFLDEMPVTVIRSRLSRFVVDLNRPPDGHALYPGQTETGLCPVSTFGGRPIYLEGEEPDDEEVATRVALFWRPYHDALAAELERIRKLHGYALLWEAHSIASRVPELFDGPLPDFNFGSNDGKASDAAGANALAAMVEAGGRYSAVVDGRFKGGYITRRFGRPERGVCALQLELSQACYLDQARPSIWDPKLAAPVQPLLEQLIRQYARSCPSGLN